MKRALIFIALLGASILAGCGGNGDTTSQSTFNNGSGDQPFKPTTHLSHRSLVTNFYASDLAVMDTTQNRLTSYTFATGNQPTYMQPSPDGTLTFVNNTGSNTISSFNNNTESVKGSIALSGYTESFVTSVNNKVGFAAVPNYNNGTFRVPGAIVRFNPTDGSLNTQIMFPNVLYIGMDQAEKHLMAFTQSDYNAYWVDLSNVDPATQVPPYYQLALKDTLGNTVTLSRPVASYFSSDNTKAYVLSCGFECGGTEAASVVEIKIDTNLTAPTTVSTGTTLDATVSNVWSVKGAQAAYFSASTNKLYVAGSTGTTSTDTGGNKVFDGWFTAIDLTSATATPTTIAIGPGTSRIIRNINGSFWVGARNCGVTSCVTLVKNDLTSKTILPLANGDATGFSLAKNSGDVYAIEGGELVIYDKNIKPVVSEYATDIKGQASDVIYIN